MGSSEILCLLHTTKFAQWVQCHTSKPMGKAKWGLSLIDYCLRLKLQLVKVPAIEVMVFQWSLRATNSIVFTAHSSTFKVEVYLASTDH